MIRHLHRSPTPPGDALPTHHHHPAVTPLFRPAAAPPLPTAAPPLPQAVWALANLSAHTDGAAAIISAGGIAPLCEVLQRVADPVQQQATRCLANLLKHESGRTQLLQLIQAREDQNCYTHTAVTVRGRPHPTHVDFRQGQCGYTRDTGTMREIATLP